MSDYICISDINGLILQLFFVMTDLISSHCASFYLVDVLNMTNPSQVTIPANQASFTFTIPVKNGAFLKVGGKFSVSLLSVRLIKSKYCITSSFYRHLIFAIFALPMIAPK